MDKKKNKGKEEMWLLEPKSQSGWVEKCSLLLW